MKIHDSRFNGMEIKNLGISSAQGGGGGLRSNQGFFYGANNVPITGVQNLGLQGGYAQYEATLGDVLIGGKRDIINKNESK